VRSKNVYIMVFFDESDIIINSAPPPPPVVAPAGMCINPLPLDQSCLAILSAKFHSTRSYSTFAFTAALNANLATCLRAAPAASDVSLVLYLNPVIVDELNTHKRIVPKDHLALDRNSGVTWSVPQSPQTFMFSMQGLDSISDVCRLTAPDQPLGSCTVEIKGSNHCFRAYLHSSEDDSLLFLEAASGGSGGVGASTIVPAVVVPVVVLLLALIGAALYYRRRRAQYMAAPSDDGQLDSPLNTTSAAPSNLSVTSAAPSDVQIRVPRSTLSAGGAKQ
jgi:hypothetical protein